MTKIQFSDIVHFKQPCDMKMIGLMQVKTGGDKGGTKETSVG